MKETEKKKIIKAKCGVTERRGEGMKAGRGRKAVGEETGRREAEKSDKKN